MDCCLKLGEHWSCWPDSISLLQKAHETLGRLCVIKHPSAARQDARTTALKARKKAQSTVCRLLLLFKMTCSDENHVSTMIQAVNKAPPLIVHGVERPLASLVTQELSALCTFLSKKGSLPTGLILHTCRTPACRCAEKVREDASFETARLLPEKSKEKTKGDKHPTPNDFFQKMKRAYLEKLSAEERCSIGALLDDLSNPECVLVHQMAKLAEVENELSEQQAISKERDPLFDELERREQQYAEQCGLMLHLKLRDARGTILCLSGVRELPSNAALVVLELLQRQARQSSSASEDTVLDIYLSTALERSQAVLTGDERQMHGAREAAALLFAVSARYSGNAELQAQDPKLFQAKINISLRVAIRLAGIASSRYKLRMALKVEAAKEGTTKTKEEKSKDDETLKAGFYYLLTSLQKVLAYASLHYSELRASITDSERAGKYQEAAALEVKLMAMYKDLRGLKERHAKELLAFDEAILNLRPTDGGKDWKQAKKMKLDELESQRQQLDAELQKIRGQYALAQAPFRSEGLAKRVAALQLRVCKWLVLCQAIAQGKPATAGGATTPRRESICADVFAKLPKHPTETQMRALQKELTEADDFTAQAGDEASGARRVIRHFKQLEAKVGKKELAGTVELDQALIDALGELERLEADLDSKRQKALAASSDAVLTDRLKDLEMQENGITRNMELLSEEAEKVRQATATGGAMQHFRKWGTIATSMSWSQQSYEAAKKKAAGAAGFNERIAQTHADASIFVLSSEREARKKIKDLEEERDALASRQAVELDIFSRSIQEAEWQVRNTPKCFMGFFRRLWERKMTEEKGRTSTMFSSSFAARTFSAFNCDTKKLEQEQIEESAKVYGFFCSELASHVDRLELLVRPAASGEMLEPATYPMYKDLLSCRQILEDVRSQAAQPPNPISLDTVREAIDQAHGIIKDLDTK